MISGLEIWLNTEPDEIARLRSMTPAIRFAASGDAQTLSQLGGELADQNQAAEFVAQANNIKWTTYSSKAARMEISLPAAPKETKGTTEENHPTTTLEATKGKLSSRAISVVFPNKPGRGQSQNYVAIALNKIAAELGMDQMQLSEISSGTFGRLAIIENNGERIKARVWVEGDVLYQLILRGDMATMNAVDDRAFFESFKALRP